MMLTGETRNSGRKKPVAMHIFQPQMSRILVWTRIRACAVRVRRQSVWAMAGLFED